jgi:hypothetical protein
MDWVGEHQDELWDEEDGFFYDVLRLPDGSGMRLRIRSTVGLLPLSAWTVFGPYHFERHPRQAELVEPFRARHPAVMARGPLVGKR